jgi:hypothetical protein
MDKGKGHGQVAEAVQNAIFFSHQEPISHHGELGALKCKRMCSSQIQKGAGQVTETAIAISSVAVMT